MANGSSDFDHEAGIATFVIRIRLERPSSGGERPQWVAHITNVLEQSERYVRDLSGLMQFIDENLTRMRSERRVRRRKPPGSARSPIDPKEQDQ